MPASVAKTRRLLTAYEAAERRDHSRSHAHLVQAVRELEDAIDEAPAYSHGAISFLKAELRELTRRLGNCRKVLGGEDRDTAA